MNVGNSVRKALEDWEHGDLESAMLHACNAVDGTAKKLHSDLGSRARFTRLLRDNYAILGPMSAPGIDLAQTTFPVRVKTAKAASRGPDIADVIYGIHRCSHGHGDELPAGFELIKDAAGPKRLTRLEVARGKLRLSDRIIFGLLAVAVLSPANKGQAVPAGYHLSFGEAVTLNINEWWGRASEFPSMVAHDTLPLVKLDFGKWLD